MLTQQIEVLFWTFSIFAKIVQSYLHNQISALLLAAGISQSFDVHYIFAWSSVMLDSVLFLCKKINPLT